MCAIDVRMRSAYVIFDDGNTPTPYTNNCVCFCLTDYSQRCFSRGAASDNDA